MFPKATFLLEMFKHVDKSFAAMSYVVQGLCPKAQLTLKVENCPICIVDTQIAPEFMVEEQFILPLKSY